MVQPTILVVDDESDVVDLVRFHLQKSGMKVLTAHNGLEALDIARQHRPEVLILDVMMPHMDGFQVCQELKKNENTKEMAVLLLTAKGEPADRIHGLELGADDYLPKPFSPKELILRIRNLLKKSTINTRDTEVHIGPFYFNKATFEFRLHGEKIELTVTEFKLLSLLLERRGKVLTREILLYDVWGYRNLIDTRTVDTHMRRLRTKLGEEADWIETIRGEGYRFLTKLNSKSA